ncbi:Ca-activated chloride channel family protein [Actinocorallia herbida]|uniref:Ca-activated chloride channel family protein n=1 Tax=Actinocorallia herbida TaxID=58109 RepID=A0A3N1DA60_9ACTN|nr:VIT domain-containing protein [Actinocorallia herbida]ROO90390.1 Ca-activated chloride channel family protein [Actinocorallia herbida]
MTVQTEATGEHPAAGSGVGTLQTSEGGLPLASLAIHTDITGLAAAVEVVQEFRNSFTVPLAATYVFPLPDRAAVTGLVMQADGRVVRAELRERGEARQVYEEAIASGRRASLAEEDRPDVFSMSVGNILPGERVTIRLSLSQPLPYEDGTAVFRFPLVVAPRYIPGSPLPGPDAGLGVQPDTAAVPDASRISPPILLPGFPDPVTLSLTARIDPAGLPLGPLDCTHPLAQDPSGLVTLGHGQRLDRDFVLRLPYGDRAPEPSAEPVADPVPGLTESLLFTPDAEGDEGTFTLTLLPAVESDPRPKDVVLVLDRSGSMHGWKMVAARRAAARIIDSLHGRDRFAVFSFDHAVETPAGLPQGLADATDRHRFRAVEHLAKIEARGATEMLRPLRDALALLGAPGRDRVLVLVTDGQVGNEDQILAALPPAELDGIRVHTVGIDRAVNAGFLGRLAAYGQGRCELVESEDRLDTAMEQIHHRIAAPILTGLTLRAGEGLEILPETVSPARPASVFPGVPLVLSGRYRGSGSSLSALATGPSWERTFEAVTVASSPATALWARAHLRDLEDGYASDPSPERESRLVATSLRHGVLCRFTAYVAVDSRVVTDGADPHQVIQPVELPQGWETLSLPTPPPMQVAMPAPMAAAPRSRSAVSFDAAPPAPGGYGAPPPAPAAPGGARPLPKQGARPSPRPGGAAPRRSAAPPVPDLTPLFSLELQRLRALSAAPDPVRLAHLTDLVTRLEALAVPALADLLASFPTLPDPLTLWPLLEEALTALTTPTPSAPTTRRPFWKR